ncbi:hypothetical protein BHE74_00054189 [Ensete ventricosum]|nr:hypothetical protein GW17_00001822 [Ensete ventricosum]RWW40402.1 hypothetical protein BHE74_00054189 [Ensete ventricosum]RZS25970.1 hypothetical protein BHM03_00059252 [Ensete ventricosum]
MIWVEFCSSHCYSLPVLFALVSPVFPFRVCRPASVTVYTPPSLRYGACSLSGFGPHFGAPGSLPAL